MSAGKARRTAPQVNAFLWTGGKGRVVPLIRAILDDRGWYPFPGPLVEAFTGSGALTLMAAGSPLTTPSEVVWCDAVQPLLTSYRAFRDTPSQVVDHIRQIQALVGGTMTQEGFAQVRSWLNHPVSDAQQAAAFLVVNWSGYNGLWRTNKAGKCNTPWGKWELTKDWDTLVAQVQFTSERLKRFPLTLEHWDARVDRDTPIDAFLRRHRVRHADPMDPAPNSGHVSPPVTIYVDSPYPDTYSGYAGTWSTPDFVLLTKRLLRWHGDFGARVFVSFPAEHRHLLPAAWDTVPLEVPNLIGHTVASRGVRQEVLVFSPTSAGT